MTRGVDFGEFPRLKEIVIEELAPFGFTEVVDISDEEAYWVNVINTQDGGYVGISMTADFGAFGMSYETGCRPLP